MKCGGSFKIYFSSVGGEIFHMLILFLHFLKVLFYIGVELINNVRIVAGVQQSDSVIYTSVLQILFPYRLLHDIVYHVLYSRSLLVTYFIIVFCIC